MKELTSVNNPVVKDAADLKQKKNRAEQNAFLVEGLRSVEEAVSYGTVRQLFVLAAAKTPDEARMQAIVGQAAAAGADLYSVSEQVMKKIADTETPQALTAVVTKQTSSLDELTALGGTILVLDRIGDPGNLGTMIRTADAAGVSGVVLLSGCTDAFAPKAVRSTMGSLLHIPVAEGVSEDDFISWAEGSGYQLLATCLEGAGNLYHTDLQGRVAVVIGSEASGVSDSLLAAAAKKVFIPMEGRAESLNAAVAAGVVLFECLRQRVAGNGKL
ncbi:TrmH family RNA methyltransferase [uncultured Phascolarctobacterium sp.]|uniref:TrmH family RNA methyltransferase n=1 Tax=uncultured Phascolarctobacterium sp. TaxID=512296 RepID=UPI0027D99B16|nr:TrmH family RNA methyltransferase [uncultured Phascolarctobacterium sp.]